MGRPKKIPGEARDNILRIRLTDEERAVVDEAAQAKSLDSSAWARSLLIEQAKNVLGRAKEEGKS